MTKKAFIFPGQGAQKAGMGKSLFDNSQAVKELFTMADKIVGKPISSLCFSGPEEELGKTENSQIALLLCSIASLTVLHEIKPEIKADIYGGLSLGEYSAQVAAGVLSFEDALKIIKKRSELMQKACNATEGGMVSIVGLEIDKVEQVCRECEGYMTIANLNCPGQIVISGEKKYLQQASEKAKALGAKMAVVLNVAGGFHSKLMESALDEYKSFISGFKINKSNLTKVLSNVTGKTFCENDDWVELMTKQIVSPVKWQDNLQFAIQQGVEVFYELGTGKTLAGMLKRIDRKAICHNIDTFDQVALIS